MRVLYFLQRKYFFVRSNKFLFLYLQWNTRLTTSKGVISARAQTERNGSDGTAQTERLKRNENIFHIFRLSFSP